MKIRNEPTQLSANDRARILDAMQEVLDAEKFSAAPQMSAFLRYVVEQTLKGNRKRIKAYTVAVDALGKPATFDPQNDPVVRVLAGRLRASLAAHYEAHPNADIQIEIKTGSYVPQFIEKPSTDTRTTEDRIGITATSSNAQAHSADPKAAIDAPTDPLLRSNGSNSASEATTCPPISGPDSTENAVKRRPLNLPIVGLTLAILALVSAVLFKSSVLRQPEPSLAGATSDQRLSTGEPTQRSRPEKISVFINSNINSNTFEEQLTTIISGVFLESDAIRVYRNFGVSTPTRYWPEDYLISLDVLPMPSEMLVSVQIINAETGLISHSDKLSLNESAAESLTSEELTRFIGFARHLVSKDGPLMLDYQSKPESKKFSDF